MAKAIYLCRVLGDGTIDNPYRTAIRDVVDPQTGLLAFSVQDVIGQNPDGTLVATWALAIAAGGRHSLTVGNPDIDRLVDPALLSAKLNTLGAGERGQMFGRITARGVDVSAFDLTRSYRELVQDMIHTHQPAFDVLDFDVEE